MNIAWHCKSHPGKYFEPVFNFIWVGSLQKALYSAGKTTNISLLRWEAPAVLSTIQSSLFDVCEWFKHCSSCLNLETRDRPPETASWPETHHYLFYSENLRFENSAAWEFILTALLKQFYVSTSGLLCSSVTLLPVDFHVSLCFQSCWLAHSCSSAWTDHRVLDEILSVIADCAR